MVTVRQLPWDKLKIKICNLSAIFHLDNIRVCFKGISIWGCCEILSQAVILASQPYEPFRIDAALL